VTGQNGGWRNGTLTAGENGLAKREMKCAEVLAMASGDIRTIAGSRWSSKTAGD
jgi:hypothetical protein